MRPPTAPTNLILLLTTLLTLTSALPIFTPPEDSANLDTDPELLKRMQSIDCEALYSDDGSSASMAVRRSKIEWCKAAIVRRVAEVEGLRRREVEG